MIQLREILFQYKNVKLEMRGIDPRTSVLINNALPFELHPLDSSVTTMIL